MADIRSTIKVKDDGSVVINSFAKKADSSFNKVSKSSQSMGSSFAKSALKLAVLVGGVHALKKIATGFMEVANMTENFKVRLKVLLGSVAEGNKVFRLMANYASKVPFEYQKIMESATMLAGVLKGGANDINKWMPLVGDLAAAVGLGITETTEQVMRMLSAGAASADRFRERGVLAMLGFQAGVHYSAEETARMLMHAWTKVGSKFKDATTEMAKTWTGLMSMLSDKWTYIRQMLMDAGLYDAMKKALTELINKLEGWVSANQKAVGKSLAEAVENLTKAIGFLGTNLGTIIWAVKVFGIAWAALKIYTWAGLFLDAVASIWAVGAVLTKTNIVIKLAARAFYFLCGDVGKFLAATKFLPSFITGVIALFTAATIRLYPFAKGLDAVIQGHISWNDYMHASRDELNELIDATEKAGNKITWFGSFNVMWEKLKDGLLYFSYFIQKTLLDITHSILTKFLEIKLGVLEIWYSMIQAIVDATPGWMKKLLGIPKDFGTAMSDELVRSVGMQMDALNKAYSEGLHELERSLYKKLNKFGPDLWESGFNKSSQGAALLPKKGDSGVSRFTVPKTEEDVRGRKKADEMLQKMRVRMLELQGQAEAAELLATKFKYEKLIEEYKKYAEVVTKLKLEQKAIEADIGKKFRDKEKSELDDYLTQQAEYNRKFKQSLYEGEEKIRIAKKEAQEKELAFEMHINELKLQHSQEQKAAQQALIDQFAASPMSDMFTDWIMGAKTFQQAFSDMAKSIAADLMRMAIKALILKAITAGMGGLFGGFFGGGSSTIRGGAGGGYGFAEGGIATGPKSGYPATLHGTEMIIPLGSSNKKEGIGNKVTNNINIVVESQKGQSKEEAARQGREAARAFNNKIDQRIFQARRAGGILYAGGR